MRARGEAAGADGEAGHRCAPSPEGGPDISFLVEALAAGWRRDRPRPCGGPEEVRLHFEQRAAAGRLSDVDDRTATDLDLDALYARIDRAASAVGQQWLYTRLRTPLAETAEVEAFDALVEAVDGPDSQREPTRRLLARLTGPSAYLLPYLVFGALPDRPAAYGLTPLLSVVALGAVLAALTTGVPGVLALMAICAVNIVVRLSYRRRVAPILGSLPAVRALVLAGRELALPRSGLPAATRARLEGATAPLRGLLRTTAWLAFETDRIDELSRVFYEYVNFVFLLDVNALLFSLELLSRRQDALGELFDAVGEVDGALSTASFRSSLPFWCRPRFVAAGGPLRLDDVFHPLLDAPVPNSLALDGPALLVTGSNMSGKTTFLKALGVNALLARTLATCAARRHEAPPFTVLTSIGRGESLTEGTSYYLAEVRRVGTLLRAADAATPHLFLVDELFRGTNTIERIAAAKAVLARLSGGRHLTAVASHDLELVPLLHGAYAPYHFRESVEGGALSFDYRLRPGPSSTRNAIALLEWASFPPEVVNDALETVGALLAEGRFDGAREPGAG